jgi:heavy metal efflux system protein
MIERIVGAALASRVGVLAAAVLLVAAGGVALARLPVDAMPDVTTVQVQILTRAPELGALEVEQLITRPVEAALGGIPGVEEIRSISRYGISNVTIVFEDGTDLYFARQLVGERLSATQEAIPAGLERPEMGPPNTGLGEIFHFLVEGEGVSPMDLRTILDWDVAYRLRTVPGVVEVNSVGGLVKQYHVLVDPARLLAYRLSLPQIFDGVEKSNLNRGGGIVERGSEAYVVRGEGMAAGPADLEKAAVGATRDGKPILLRQVAEVRPGPRLRIGGVTANGKGEAVMGMVMMLPGANARDVVQRVKEELAEMAPTLPKGVRITPFYDRQQLVSRVIATVRSNLLEGGLLVVAVLLLVLGDLVGGLVVALAIPLSMLFAFVGMTWFGISGNLMSLGAIDFGLVVDGSVVMVENIVRRLREAGAPSGSARLEVVRSAAQEVARPVAFGVGIILIVYLPVLGLGGLEGKMFRPMAWTVVFAVTGSLLLALTVIPVLASLVLRGRAEERETFLLRHVRSGYRPLLGSALDHPRATVAAAAVLFALSLLGATRLGAEFVPRLEEGDLLVRPQRLPSVSLHEALRSTTEMEKALLQIPEIRSAVTRTGSPELATDPIGFDASDCFVNLKPKNEWRRGLTHEGLIADIEKAVEERVPGSVFSFSQPIEDRFEELIAGVTSDVGVKIFGDDLDVLAAKGKELVAILGQVRGAADVRAEQTAGLPLVNVRVDRDRLARYGVSVDAALAAVEAAKSGRIVGSVFEGRRRFDIAVRLAEGVGEDPRGLASVPVATPDGKLVPLSELASIELTEGPAQISREQIERRFVVEANVRGRDLASFVTEARDAVGRKLALPPGYYVKWSGQFEHLSAASRRLLVAVPLALLLIFGLLYGAFGAVRPALLIFLNVPLAATGGIFALLLRGMPFSISAGVGFIALCGVAVLNGVVLVSFIRKLQAERRLAPLAAAALAAEVRLRPILMTALVASLGFLPMALATGAGAEVQKPLATVVIGGLVTSTLLTLVVLPTVYRWFADEDDSLARA